METTGFRVRFRVGFRVGFRYEFRVGFRVSFFQEKSRKRRAADSRGAIIESMHHHGKGVYSGTFSGTLNPALQDANGQPKRDITTIVHILNDLLCAQYKAYSSGSRSSRHREGRSSQATDTKQPYGKDEMLFRRTKSYSAGRKVIKQDEMFFRRTKCDLEGRHLSNFSIKNS